VADGEELVDYLLRRGKYESASASPRPDLILLDLNMPRKDGREALKEIRAHQELRRVPVVVFTTSRADTDIERVYELGANSFVTKPAGFDELVATVTQLTGYWFGTARLPGNAKC
jgi:CheY-like chemotaxis protein